jgi:hypothetical protein
MGEIIINAGIICSNNEPVHRGDEITRNIQGDGDSWMKVKKYGKRWRNNKKYIEIIKKYRKEMGTNDLSKSVFPSTLQFLISELNKDITPSILNYKTLQKS